MYDLIFVVVGLLRKRESGDGVLDIGYLRIAVDATCAADVDHYARLLVFHSEVGCCGAHELEGCGIMHG